MDRSINYNISRITQHLIINSSYIDDLGLYNGKIGIVIYFYHLSRFSKNSTYYDYAGKLLDEVYNQINTETPINFKNGLCGIGWALEHLLENKFIEGNSDEILFDIDQKIMEFNPVYSHDKSFENGATGILFYILTRLLLDKNKKSMPFSNEYLLQWKIVCLNEIYKKNELSHFCHLFLQYLENKTINFTTNKLLLNIIPSITVIDDDFIYLSLGLKNGSAGIGLKNILQ